LRDNLATLERQLAAKEAYLAASAEMHNRDRQLLLEETRLLLKEVAKNGGLFDDTTKTEAVAATATTSKREQVAGPKK
jgi:hypothetical protein